MASDLAERTARYMTSFGLNLKTTLEHKNQVFNYSHLATVAAFINKKHIPVVISKTVTDALHSYATYLHENIVDIHGDVLAEGNTLYLSDIPEKIGPILPHEAVHIYADLHGKSEFMWDHEELAYFVEGFITSQIAPRAVKRVIGSDDRFALGFFASEFYNASPNTGAVSSKNFNKEISYDFKAEGGFKGKINPYKTLARIISSSIPGGKIGRKKQSYHFRGVFVL